MKVAYEDSLAFRVEQKINKLPYNVVLRGDLEDFAGQRQLTYALNKLISERKIARIGYGLYAKLRVSKLTGEPFLREPKGFYGTIREALDRLDIEWESSEAEEAYNLNRSTQVPARSILRVKKRLRRKIAYENNELKYKRAS